MHLAFNHRANIFKLRCAILTFLCGFSLDMYAYEIFIFFFFILHMYFCLHDGSIKTYFEFKWWETANPIQFMRWFGFKVRSCCLVSTNPVKSRICACIMNIKAASDKWIRDTISSLTFRWNNFSQSFFFFLYLVALTPQLVNKVCNFF